MLKILLAKDEILFDMSKMPKTQLPFLLPKKTFLKNTLILSRHRHEGKLLNQAEGYALGKSMRKLMPRKHLANICPRPATVSAMQVYHWSNLSRLRFLLPIRAKRMSVSAFTYYRGMPSLMLYDKAWQADRFGTSGLMQQICGDCHLSNFGGFASPERNLLFGLNDFDETLVAPFEWDIKRLVTSIMVAVPTMGLSESVGLTAIAKFLQSYCDGLESHRSLSPLQVWYEKVDAGKLMTHTEDNELKEQWRQTFEKAKLNVAAKVLPKMTEQNKKTGRRYFKDEPPIQQHPKQSQPFGSGVAAFFSAYRDSLKFDRQVLFDRYEISDVSLKVVGVGSVGLVSAVALFEDADHEPLILQMKQAKPSILAPLFMPNMSSKRAAAYRVNEGERVVHGQQLMQAASDIFLGFSQLNQPVTRDFYVRQLRDMKYAAALETMTANSLYDYVEHCGMALAHAHAKAGNADMVMGYIGKATDIIPVFQQYAIAASEQNQQDYDEFMAQIEAGNIKVAGDDVL